MCGKFFCGMLTGLAVGTSATLAAKCFCDKKDAAKIKRKAKKMLDRVEQYVNENMNIG